MKKFVPLLAMVMLSACGLAAPVVAHPLYPDLDRVSVSSERASSVKKKTLARKMAVSETRSTVHTGKGSHSKAIAEARRYIGTKPNWVKRGRLWCNEFINGIEQRVGRNGTGSGFAKSYLSDPRYKKVRDPRPGDIAVFSRGGKYGHSGYFTGWSPEGKPIILSGNSCKGRVCERAYSKAPIAFVRPV